MAPTPSIDALASAIVAQFLRTNNYTETLQAFLREAGLPSLLEEKKAFDHSANFERYGEDTKDDDMWTVPAPSKPTVIQTPTSSNILAASVEPWQYSSDGADVKTSALPLLASTGADKQIHLLDTKPDHASLVSFSGLSDSPVLSLTSILQGRYILMTNMSGYLLLQHRSHILDSRKDHAKYAVKVVAHEEGSENGIRRFWIATAGWDATVFLYRIEIPDEDMATDSSPVLGEPVARIKLPTNPESLVFVPHIDSGELLLLVSRRDSTHIFYYQVSSSSPELPLLGQQNLAPHSNAWVAFSPAHMALSPRDPGLLAIATSALPHMKVMIVRLLFPSAHLPGGPEIPGPDSALTQATQAMAALALQNREDTAILLQANTFAPQTAYSTPQVAWRPDGSGVWVNGDDGLVRGIEAKTGKLMTVLKDGHELGYKVRTIWAGYVDVAGKEGESIREEWVVSGGFDKRLIVWKV
ncbi:uncharacterized protein N7483_009989 [Penicillium malachiteum]|uniref:uncharacterized protein n=1 Tax=Penicillium malachiteum TaxID=1324776 RepID=UPI002548D054|nr:uncharacterized protein N7483_009989 [Penicillium malachiteum]KAJ5718907.1 hypothetical protein N7483_009989 [Penicillium malachiteum]